MAISDLLFGSQPLPTVNTSSSTTSQYPEWYSRWLNQLYGKASSVAAEGYQPYTGPRIAPFNQDTQQSFGQVRGAAGAYQPQLAQAGSMVSSAGGAFDPQEFQGLMSPYVSNVVDRIGTLAGRNLSENLLPAVNDSFIRAGQFGSSRNEDFTLRALRDTQESALAEQNRALAQGYDSSMDAYQNMLDRRLQAGQQTGALAQLGQGLRYQDAAALAGIGQQQEDKTQQSLNLGYQDFTEQRDYPRSQVEWLSSIMRGYQPTANTTTYGSQPGTTSQMAPNLLGQLAGTALGIYGLTGGFKKGGRVRRGYAMGGATRPGPAMDPIAPTRPIPPALPPQASPTATAMRQRGRFQAQRQAPPMARPGMAGGSGSVLDYLPRPAA